MDWNPDQYHRFADERRLPFEDLWRLATAAPGLEVVDLGCGTGELTRELGDRLPGSNVLGLDSSEEMLARARVLEHPGLRFACARIEDLEGSFDLIFSNAALHWVEDHPALLPRLLGQLRPGGQLLVQVPSNHGHPAHLLSGTLAGEEPFRSALGGWVRQPPVLALDEYAQVLHGAGAVEIELLEKVYLHQLPDAAAVTEWTRGTTLLPYLARLGELAEAYLERYRERLAALMPGRPVLFTFRRILMAARRGG
jgi:trans-aconitate 2-methyltransferase